MGLYSHDNSMAEQGAWYQVEVSGTGNSVSIPAGVTNVLIYNASGTAQIDRFKTVERSGRKLRLMARSDSSAIQINEGENIYTTGSDTTIQARDTIEFMCAPDANGTLYFVETNLGNIT